MVMQSEAVVATSKAKYTEKPIAKKYCERTRKQPGDGHERSETASGEAVSTDPS